MRFYHLIRKHWYMHASSLRDTFNNAFPLHSNFWRLFFSFNLSAICFSSVFCLCSSWSITTDEDFCFFKVFETVQQAHDVPFGSYFEVVFALFHLALLTSSWILMTLLTIHSVSVYLLIIKCTQQCTCGILYLLYFLPGFI